jgi:hypothetical protein
MYEAYATYIGQQVANNPKPDHRPTQKRKQAETTA